VAADGIPTGYILLFTRAADTPRSKVDELLKTQPFIQLTNLNQTTIGSQSRSLEIDLQGSIEQEQKGLALILNHGVGTSEASSLRLEPHKYG
jgi:hypothetical protein